MRLQPFDCYFGSRDGLSRMLDEKPRVIAGVHTRLMNA